MPLTTSEKPAPSPSFFPRAISSKHRSFLIVIKTFRCEETRRKSTCFSSVSISTKGFSVPRPDEGREVVGGYTQMEYQGTARRILHCDVTSLYPSIMLVYDYLPEKDELGIFAGLLRDLRRFRLKAKELARDARDEESQLYFNALQATFKILINSFYGYLGFQMGHFNDFAAANQVTAKGEVDSIRGRMAQRKGCADYRSRYRRHLLHPAINRWHRLPKKRNSSQV